MIPCDHPGAFTRYVPIDDYGEEYFKVCTICKKPLGDVTREQKIDEIENRPGYDDRYDRKEKIERKRKDDKDEMDRD